MAENQAPPTLLTEAELHALFSEAVHLLERMVERGAPRYVAMQALLIAVVMSAIISSPGQDAEDVHESLASFFNLSLVKRSMDIIAREGSPIIRPPAGSA